MSVTIIKKYYKCRQELGTTSSNFTVKLLREYTLIFQNKYLLRKEIDDGNNIFIFWYVSTHFLIFSIKNVYIYIYIYIH